MVHKRLFLMGAGALAISSAAIAGQPLAPVVSLHYTVRENDTETLQKIVTVPLERVLQKLERVAQIKTSTNSGTVDVEIGFQGPATPQDVAAVTSQIEMLKFDDAVVIVSRAIELRAPRLSFDEVQARP